MTTYFYGRNSDVESYEKGSSIDTQLSKVKSYCNIKNLELILKSQNKYQEQFLLKEDHKVMNYGNY